VGTKYWRDTDIKAFYWSMALSQLLFCYCLCIYVWS